MILVMLPIGQGSLLQACVSELSAPQSSPLCSGGGLSQVLVRVWFPPPQARVQLSHSDHSVHPPSERKGFFTVKNQSCIQEEGYLKIKFYI